MEISHFPVMNREVISILSKKKGGIFIDCTVGLGGHAALILDLISGSNVIGIDMDTESLKIAAKNLKRFGDRIKLINLSYEDIFEYEGIDWDRISGILVDPGLSMYQLKNEKRGFSHISSSRLDMRKDQSSELSAFEVVNNFPESELSRIFKNYGDVNKSDFLAKRIIERRLFAPIETTGDLKNIVEEVFKWKATKGKSHPAARVFQSLRIYVNSELERVEEFIEKVPGFLKKGSLLLFLTYHSVEDRLVKRTMKSLVNAGKFSLLKPFPFKPSDSEVKKNNPSRSAKLRVVSVA